VLGLLVLGELLGVVLGLLVLGELLGVVLGLLVLTSHPVAGLLSTLLLPALQTTAVQPLV
jgi:hypothetical protein